MALTTPQVKMLTRAMRDSVWPARQQWKTAGNLERSGLLVSGGDGRMDVTLAGLNALRDHRRARYGLHGSMASILDLEEVEAEIRNKVAGA